MKYRLLVKLILGVTAVILLAIIGLKMIDTLSGLLIGVFTNAEVGTDGYENELVTPEPMPTMPGYIGEDSFYDSAGSVDFNGE